MKEDELVASRATRQELSSCQRGGRGIDVGLKVWFGMIVLVIFRSLLH